MNFRLLIALSVLGLFAAGCNKDTVTPPVIDANAYRPLTTAAAPLVNVGLCYARNDSAAVVEYRQLFDLVTYVFNFSDPSDDPRGDGYFGYGPEVATAESLFTDREISSIDLKFLTNPSDTLGMDPGQSGLPPGTRKFVVTGIELRVTRGSTEYTARGSCTFYIAPSSGSQGTVWRIVRWDDMTGTPVAAARSSLGGGMRPNVLPATWGRVKSLYYLV
jgi:hypothetical protein